jgi:hypothetical protein
MDVSDASYYNSKKKEVKVAKWGTPKKNLSKSNNIIVVKNNSITFSSEQIPTDRVS